MIFNDNISALPLPIPPIIIMIHIQEVIIYNICNDTGVVLV